MRASGAERRSSLMLDNAPPPATRDELPSDCAVNRRLDQAFAKAASAYGFEEVSTPLFERADLFAARSGSEIRNALLTFHCDHEEYALRPELTAPVCRLVASGALSERPQPHKLFYVGPCFRYCRPHSGRQRQFTQAGLEVLGDSSAQADAEVIAAAHRFLRAVGIRDPRLTIGTAGIFRSLLPAELSADERAAVIGHLDRLAAIRERCATVEAREDPLLLEQLRMDRRDLATMQAQDGYEGPFAIADLPAPAASEMAGRLPEEAAATFRHLWNVQGYLPEQTGELLVRTSGIRGRLDSVAKQAGEALGGTSADSALAELMEVCRLLGHYGIKDFDVSLGIGRGLTFYTGTMFELSSAGGKLCGGGRYDNLVELFGGDPTPATGCAVRFDSLKKSVGTPVQDGPPIGIALVPHGPEDEADAVRLAEELRDLGATIGATGAPRVAVQAGRAVLPDGSETDAKAGSIMESLNVSWQAPQLSGREI